MASTDKSSESFQWSYSPTDRCALLMRGISSQEPLGMLAVLVVNVDPGDEVLERVQVLASGDLETIRETDLDQSPENIFREIKKFRRQQANRNTRRSSARVQEQLQDYFTSAFNLDTLAKDLRKEEKSQVVLTLEKFLEEHVLAAADCRTEVIVRKWRGDLEASHPDESPNEEDSAREEGPEAEIQDEVEHLLEIELLVDPVAGRELGDLNLEDELMIRVVGRSAKKLTPALLDSESTSDYPVSRPIPADLAALKVESDREIKFWTRIRDGIFGRGVQPSRTRVKLHRSDRQGNEAATFLYMMGALMIILSLAIFLLFVGAPDLLFALYPI